MDSLVFVKSNFGVNPEKRLSSLKKKEAHPVLIYQNYRFWWKKDNIDRSSRYCFAEKNTVYKCSASMTIKSNNILRYQNNHSHREHGLEEIPTYTAYQELKQEISSDITKSIKTAYNETQRRLIEENIPDRTVVVS
ncbi:unnamed protein product [Brachionus calyciflorus]|uniref:FLYWCH-type domain-containing protein n=1 Tax=Brachionus calyciflorus TaxID=104777 RepID=A0A813T142_9BILA|nr:unnamed protein product [Brachionus calyciflorus]